MKRCDNHIIGQYDDGAESPNYRLGSEHRNLLPAEDYYTFCPDCGTRITKAIIKRQEAL